MGGVVVVVLFGISVVVIGVCLVVTAVVVGVCGILVVVIDGVVLFSSYCCYSYIICCYIVSVIVIVKVFSSYYCCSCRFIGINRVGCAQCCGSCASRHLYLLLS